MIMSMRKESGEITTDREEILKICANFYKSLYTQTVPTPESTMKSSPDTEEIPEFTEEEVERAIKRMKIHKAQGVDGITNDILKLGGPIVLTYLTNIFNNILKTKQIPDSWHEAKIVILSKKGDPKDIKNYRPISLLSHSYKIFTRLLQTRIERTLDENQPREQAGFRKGYSTTDHLQALNQIIEKSNEYNLPLCIGFIDYEKAFDTVEHFAIFEALRKTNVNETYINILQNIYNQATARVHLDKLVSTEFPVHRGVRQGDPLSPKLFTAVMEEVFKKADISEGVNVQGRTKSIMGGGGGGGSAGGPGGRIGPLAGSRGCFFVLFLLEKVHALGRGVRRRCCSFQRNNKTNGKTPEQSKLRKPESWLKNTQRKDKVHDKPCRQRRHTNRSAKN